MALPTLRFCVLLALTISWRFILGLLLKAITEGSAEGLSVQSKPLLPYMNDFACAKGIILVF